MANSLVIRKGTNLEKRSRALRAAQYVRMSTELQRYSIENQAAAIAAYAQDKNLTIVRTYRDDGRSGLKIKGRAGLIELIDDIESGRADFDHVLVYDVSRWGRFQDADESAHYEFVCKKNGVRVAYCAEQFDNDGSLVASVVKNIKRVMAAEFSRELSVKVHTGQCRLAGLGFRVGGPLGFGLRREMVDEKGWPKGHLNKGEHKSLKTDHVRLRRGTDEEAEVVRWIFRQFAIERHSEAEIARRLNQMRMANGWGIPWSAKMVDTILRNENYVGNLVYNRTSRRLGQKEIKNPPEAWVRSDSGAGSIVERQLFDRAQKVIADRYVSIPEDEMLKRLRVVLNKKGRLSERIINSTPGLPSVNVYCNHFGSIRKTYAIIGYTTSHDCRAMDARRHWDEILISYVRQLATALRIDLTRCTDDGLGLSITDNCRILFRTARSKKNKPNEWRAYFKKTSVEFLAVLRVDDVTKAIHDYVLLPTPRPYRRYVIVSDTALPRLRAVRVQTFEALVREIKARGAMHNRAARAKTTTLNRQARPSRPTAKNGRPPR
ncbi:DNA invertase Pin-like site-specific DNA recombinase [Bradyrhizobium sp. USDA 4449]